MMPATQPSKRSHRCDWVNDGDDDDDDDSIFTKVQGPEWKSSSPSWGLAWTVPC